MAKAKAKKAAASNGKAAKKPAIERLPATVSDRVLEETPARATKFLQGVASRSRIARALALRGYGPPEQGTGWRLLAPVLKLSAEAHAPTKTPQGEAIAQLDAWDDQNLGLWRAALRGDLAAAGAFIVGDLEVQHGAASVAIVSQLLSRVAAVRTLSAEATKAGVTKELARATIKKLERRGYPAAELDRLAALVTTAQSTPDATPEDPTAEIERHNDLVRLREWYEEVVALARRTVSRKDDLIALGLAERRSAAETDPTEPQPSPAPPAA
jgi:hypothetical protein